MDLTNAASVLPLYKEYIVIPPNCDPRDCTVLYYWRQRDDLAKIARLFPLVANVRRKQRLQSTVDGNGLIQHLFRPTKKLFTQAVFPLFWGALLWVPLTFTNRSVCVRSTVRKARIPS